MKTLNFASIDKALNVLFSFGAAVVIFGAMAKILHWRNADIFIMIGLLTEVAIFSIMGFVEMVKPKQLVETTQPSKSPASYSQQLPHVELTDQLIQFRSNLERINKMMGNILNSNK
jgi:hypothetical protein